MTEKPAPTTIDLDPALDDQPEHVDHPDEITEVEAAEGQVVYEAVDDLDDDSTGGEEK